MSAENNIPFFFLLLFLAISYAPLRPDEVEMKIGEMFEVTKMHEDGWATVMKKATGEKGLVPANYLEAVKK